MIGNLIETIRVAIRRLINAVLRRFRHEPFSPEFAPPKRADIDFEYQDTESPLKIRTGALPSTVAPVQLRDLFTDPHANLKGLQRKTADVILGSVGASYLPSRLLQLLNQADAFQATRQFLELLRLDYDQLLRSETEREFLDRMIYVLVEVDAVLRDSGLDDRPFYVLMATRPADEEVENYVERLRKVASIVKSLKSREIVFPEFYSDFLPKALEATEAWERVDDELIADIYEAYLGWQEYQDDYERFNPEIDELISLIYSRAPERGSELRRIVNAVEHIRAAAKSSMMTAAEVLDELNLIREDLNRIFESIPKHGGKKSERWKARAPYPSEEEELKHALKILGLTYPDGLERTTIKRAFRTLAHRHHPDKKGSNEKFIELRKAYDYLSIHLDRRKGSSV